VERVDALSLDEALLLARELPHLRALIQDELSGVGPEVARRLALGVLNIAQGHPKLLELADGQAAEPVRLGALVEAGDQAWRQAGGIRSSRLSSPPTAGTGRPPPRSMRSLTATRVRPTGARWWPRCGGCGRARPDGN